MSIQICILLLLIFSALIFAQKNNFTNTAVIFDSRKIVSSSKVNKQTTDSPIYANYDDNYNEDDVIYVCGGGDNLDEEKCTCINETLNCNQGFYSYYFADALKHSKIKIRDENFTAKVVDIGYNNLKIIKKNEFLPGHESKVELLRFYVNDIERIESEAFDKFTSLKTLDLERNQLKSMNNLILTRKLGTSLKELKLSFNDLQNLSTTVFQYLTTLTSLNLKRNGKINLVSKINDINVTIFPEALSNHLKTLNLAWCNIKHFDDNVFINLRSLENVDISNNPLITVPKALKKLSNLEYLSIMFSEIVSINDCDFCGLSNLKNLNLKSSFHLSYIDENAFGALTNKSFMPKLEEFSLITARLSVLPEKMLNWKNVSRIDIYVTSLACNCSMAWLINDYNSPSPSIVDNLIDKWNRSHKNDISCNSPRALGGRYFHTLPKDFCMNNKTSALNSSDPEIAAPTTSTHEQWKFCFLIFLIISLFVGTGIYFKRNRKFMQIRKKFEADEDILKEDFDMEAL